MLHTRTCAACVNSLTGLTMRIYLLFDMMNNPLAQVAPKEVLHARNSLSGLTARILAYPPMPTTLSGVEPGKEFPDVDSAARVLSELVRIRSTDFEVSQEDAPQCPRLAGGGCSYKCRCTRCPTCAEKPGRTAHSRH